MSEFMNVENDGVWEAGQSYTFQYKWSRTYEVLEANLRHETITNKLVSSRDVYRLALISSFWIDTDWDVPEEAWGFLFEDNDTPSPSTPGTSLLGGVPETYWNLELLDRVEDPEKTFLDTYGMTIPEGIASGKYYIKAAPVDYFYEIT